MRSSIISRFVVFSGIVTVVFMVYASATPSELAEGAESQYVIDNDAARTTQVEPDGTVDEKAEVADAATTDQKLESEVPVLATSSRLRSPFLPIQTVSTGAEVVVQPRRPNLKSSPSAGKPALKQPPLVAKAGSSPWKVSGRSAKRPSMFKKNATSMFRPFDGKQLFRSNANGTYGLGNRNKQSAYFRKWWQ